MVEDTSRNVQPMIPPDRAYVSRIEVEGLFGHYDYDLDPYPNYGNASKLLILYGENGSRKTTLLWLVYHLLIKSGTGHKTFVARTRFKRLSIRLGSELLITAEREHSTVGSFLLRIENAEEKHELYVRADDPGNVVRMTSSPDEADAYKAMLNRLPDLKLKFLRDNRRVFVDEDQQERDELRHSRSMSGRLLHKESDPNLTAPELAVRRVNRWVGEQALLGSTEGQLNVNSVYADIIKGIGTSKKKDIVEEVKPDVLIRSLIEQEHITKKFSEYGLTSDLNTDSFVESIQRNKGSKQRLQIIDQILRPFIDGNAARLNALNEVHKSIRTFVESLNSFYRNKSVVFHLRTGLRVLSENESRIPIRKLSSGEQELLLLFCNVLVSNQAIFIIDEPELSLNIVWQRKLIDSLLGLSAGSQVQFLLATHSIEILAQCGEAVLPLKNKARHAGN